jgi:hypothetical protein
VRFCIFIVPAKAESSSSDALPELLAVVPNPETPLLAESGVIDPRLRSVRLGESPSSRTGPPACTIKLREVTEKEFPRGTIAPDGFGQLIVKIIATTADHWRYLLYILSPFAKQFIAFT